MHTTVKIPLEGESVLLRYREDQYARKGIWDTNRHCHSEYELHIILEGGCRVDVEERCYSLPEKSAILIAPGQYHHPVSLEPGFSRFTLGLLPSGKLAQQLQKRLMSCAVFPVNAQILRLCSDVFYESAAGNAYRQEVQQALITQLAVYTLRMLGLSQRSRETAGARRGRLYSAQALPPASLPRLCHPLPQAPPHQQDARRPRRRPPAPGPPVCPPPL